MRKETSCERYAALAAYELALVYRDGIPLSARKIAMKHNLSIRFLARIMDCLRLAGVVDAERGPSGGFRLAIPPNELTFGFLTSVIEREFEGARDEDDEQLNLSSAAHKIFRVWREAEERKREYLNNILFSDLIDQPDDETPLNFTI